MKRTGIIALLVLLILIGLPLILLNTSYFQQRLVVSLTKELKQQTGAKIYIEDSDIDLFRGIVLHHVQVDDSLNHRILKAERLDIGLRILPLLRKRFELDALRLIHADIQLSRKTPESDLNIQSILHAFKKPKKKTVLPWHFDFSTIILRNCRIRYDVLSKPVLTKGLDASHIDVLSLSAKLGLKIAPKNHFQFWVYKFQAVEKSGLKIDKLKLQAKLSETGFNLKDFELRSDNSSIEISSLDAKYKGFSAFKNFADSVRFAPTNIKLNVLPSDFTCVNPLLSNLTKSVELSIAVEGKLADLTCRKLRLNLQNEILLDGRIALKGLPDVKDLYMKGQIEMLRITPQGFEYLSGVLTNKFAEIQALRNLGTINYMGHINTVNHRWVLTGDFATAAGNVSTNITLSKKNGIVQYEGKVNTGEFQLGMLFPEKKTFDKVAFDLSVNCFQDPVKGLYGSIEGNVPHFFLNGYDYQNLALNGLFNKKGFEGKATLDDVNAKLNFSGLVNLSEQSPKFKFDLYADNVNLQPLNLTSRAGSNLSFNLHSNFEGRTIDDVLGKVSIDSLVVFNNKEWFHLGHLDIESGKDLFGKHLLISSNILNGKIWGKYTFSSLSKSLKTLARNYCPSLIKPETPDFRFNNDFAFNGTMLPSPELAKVLGVSIILEKNLDFQGFYNDLTGKFRVKADAPKLVYGKLPVQSASILFENPQNEAKLIAFAEIGSIGKELKMNVDARALNDITALKFNISNSLVNTYSGDVKSDLHFSRGIDNMLQIDAKLKESTIILSDSVWKIHPTDLRWEDKRLFVQDFQLTHSGQFIKIQGYASAISSDTMSVQMNSFSLDDLFMILLKKNSNINFGGLVTGQAKCMRLMKDPAMNADLSVENFSFNHAVLGHLTAKSKWNNAMKALALDAVIRSNKETDGVHPIIANASGAFFPGSDSMFLAIDANHIPLGFLEPYLGKILYKLDAVATGNAHLIGPVKKLGVYAKAYVENASFGVQMLNTRYRFSDSVLVSPRIVVFRNVEVKDREGNTAVATGIIRHNYWKNMQTSIEIKADKRILAMDIPPTSEAYFYGTAYATGTVSINGPQDNIVIDVNVKSEDKTKATISFQNNAKQAEYSFINFIQKKKVNEDYDRDLRNKKTTPTLVTTPSNLTVNLYIDATPNAELTLITDPSSGDEIKGRGKGAIHAVFHQNDPLKLFGRYTIERGSYKFVYENILRRDFTIENGGTINFSGDPFEAELNITANYTVNAQLSDLLSAADLNSLELNRSNIPVNCVLKLNGELQKPGIELDLAYPSADDELKRRIANVINTDEMVNQQIVFLMLFGRFSTPTYSTTVQSSTSNMSTALNTTISTVSSQLNNMINDVFGQSKMSFDFDYRNAAYELGTPGEWKVGMSAQWLDNRLTFNGNLGSRENLTTTNKSQFIGEFDFNLKFKNSEKWSAKFFNRANDNRYFKSALNTQGLGIVYKEDFNKLSDLFRQMIESLKAPSKKKEESK